MLIRKDGTEVPIDDSAAPIRDSRGSIVGIVLVFRDVTESRQSEVALLRAEKLATVHRHASSIAHELNNPLEAITNLLYLASAQPELSEKTKQYLALAENEMARAAHASSQTLAFASCIDSGELVDLCGLADQVIGLYASKSRSKQVSVRRRFRHRAFVKASSADMRRVLANLLSNSVEALGHGGAMHVRIGSSAENSRSMVRITIADTGHGIEPQNLRHIFEPFFTTKAHVATGLGLWVAREIVQRHGGDIKVRSRLGRGTVFVVSWPVSQFATRDREQIAKVAG